MCISIKLCVNRLSLENILCNLKIYYYMFSMKLTWICCLLNWILAFVKVWAKAQNVQFGKCFVFFFLKHFWHFLVWPKQYRGRHSGDDSRHLCPGILRDLNSNATCATCCALSRHFLLALHFRLCYFLDKSSTSPRWYLLCLLVGPDETMCENPLKTVKYYPKW